MSDILQRVVLNGQTCSWKSILAGVLQDSILGPLLFLIFINDLSLNLESTIKIFADDRYFSILLGKYPADKLNWDLERISAWAMLFNLDPAKQAITVDFSRKSGSGNIPVISFNNIPVSSRDCQKHLGVILDKKLAFDHHLSEKIAGANKGIGLITRLRKNCQMIDPTLDYWRYFI